MKFTPFTVAALTQVTSVLAFPAVVEDLGKRQGVDDPSKTFNPKLQYVSTEGEHAFQAPNLDVDARGPCPGLNALANHGYLPRNGVGSHLDFITGTFEGFGMSADLSGFLTVLGAVLDGNGLEWSIGGPNSALPGLKPLLGVPQGISGSHNRYETDVSPVRGDLYLYGNDYENQLNQFEQLYNMAIANGDNIDLDVMNAFRSSRFDASVAQNPYLFLGPFTGIFVSPAAFQFIYRFMGNKSEEYPQGKLNTDILMTFFAINKDSNGNFVKNPGQERFPTNFYKRAVGDEYSIPYFNLDMVLAAEKYPKFLSVGGNVGKPNSFVGVEIDDLTGGLMNAQQLTQGNNLACFSMNFAAQAAVDQLKCSGVVGNIESAMSTLNNQLVSSLAGLDCPTLANLSQTQFSQYPGYTKLNCQTGTY